MRGNKRKGIVLQERDRQLLRELAIMRIVDREQAKRVAGFHSTTRINARLLALTRAGFLRRFYSADGQKAYYTLTAMGAQIVGAPHRGLQRRKDEAAITGSFVQHQLAVNEMYCRLKFSACPDPAIQFLRWETFDEPFATSLLPDGYVELTTPSGVIAAFLEVDLGTERIAVWEQKVRKYLHLAVSGEYPKQFGQERFRVLVIANSDRRRDSIRNAVASVTDKIFWFSTLERIERGGMFASVWLRPKGDDPQPFVRMNP
jgi:hypothetical protein